MLRTHLRMHSFRNYLARKYPKYFDKNCRDLSNQYQSLVQSVGNVKGTGADIASAHALGLSFLSFDGQFAKLSGTSVTNDQRDSVHDDVLKLQKHVIQTPVNTIINGVVKRWPILITLFIAFLTVVGALYGGFIQVTLGLPLSPLLSTSADYAFLGFSQGLLLVSVVMFSLSLPFTRLARWAHTVQNKDATVKAATDILSNFHYFRWKTDVPIGLVLLIFAVASEAFYFNQRMPMVNVFLREEQVLRGQILGGTSDFVVMRLDRTGHDKVIESRNQYREKPLVQTKRVSSNKLAHQSGVIIPKDHIVCIATDAESCVEAKEPTDNDKLDPKIRTQIEAVGYLMGRYRRSVSARALLVEPSSFARELRNCEPYSDSPSDFWNSPIFYTDMPMRNDDDVSLTILDGQAVWADAYSKLVDFIRQSPKAYFEVAGFASGTGGPSRNFDLSERRAHWIAFRLSNLLMEEQPTLRVSGYGETIQVRKIGQWNDVVIKDEESKEWQYVLVIACRSR